MMNRLACIPFAALLVSTAVAAQPPTGERVPVAYPPAAKPAPVFDCFHINFAWGFRLGGRFIDADGTIYRYEKQKPAWLPQAIDENGARYLTQADLDAKYVERVKIGSIVASEIELHRASIEAAAQGKLVQSGPAANDAGSSSCHAYVRDTGNDRYRDVNLGTDGGVSDAPLRNDSAQAQELIAWLKSVGVSK
ncbi:MAG: hypothetical protein ABI846_14940 [Rudaea sp.]